MIKGMRVRTEQYLPIIVIVYRVLKNNVYNVSGMIEEVKTKLFFYLAKL